MLLLHKVCWCAQWTLKMVTETALGNQLGNRAASAVMNPSMLLQKKRELWAYIGTPGATMVPKPV